MHDETYRTMVSSFLSLSFFLSFFPVFFFFISFTSSSLVSRSHKSTWVDARRKHWRWNHTAVANGNGTRLKEGKKERKKEKKVNHIHTHRQSYFRCSVCFRIHSLIPVSFVWQVHTGEEETNATNSEQWNEITLSHRKMLSLVRY